MVGAPYCLIVQTVMHFNMQCNDTSLMKVGVQHARRSVKKTAVPGRAPRKAAEVRWAR